MSETGDRVRGWLVALRDRLPRRVRTVVVGLGDRDILLAGSSLGFYGLVSLLPLLLLAFALVGNVAGQESLDRFVRETAQNGSVGVASLVGQLSSSSSSLSWLTVLAVLWPATAYGGGLRRALTHASPGEEELPGLRGRLLGIGLVFTLPILILAGVPLMFVLVRIGEDGLGGALLGGLLGFVAAVVVGTLMTALLYQVFAPEGLAWRESVAAATLVSAITAAWTLGFVLYLRIGQVEERFGGGTVGAVVLMGIWLFVSNVLLLAGYHALVQFEDER